MTLKKKVGEVDEKEGEEVGGKRTSLRRSGRGVA